eukprot:344258-Pleurochrysis_carterae.AAC.1
MQVARPRPRRAQASPPQPPRPACRVPPCARTRVRERALAQLLLQLHLREQHLLLRLEVAQQEGLARLRGAWQRPSVRHRSGHAALVWRSEAALCGEVRQPCAAKSGSLVRRSEAALCGRIGKPARCHHAGRNDAIVERRVSGKIC